MDLLESLRSKLKDQLAQRAAHDKTITDLTTKVEAEARTDFTTEETAAFAEARAKIEALKPEIAATEARLSELEGLAVERDANATRAAELEGIKPATKVAEGGAIVRSEPMTYNRGNARDGVSYFRDLAKAQLENDPESSKRLMRHAKEIDTELPKRLAATEARADRELREVSSEAFFERRTNPNRTDGQGGYFVPPLWLVDEYIPYLRAGRPFANSLRSFDLPEGTDSINIPKLATGTATAPQTADAATVTSTDFTDTSVAAGVKTIAGQQDVSMQLLEQSPGQIIDQVILQDLFGSYNQQTDNQCLNGSNASGQVQGIDGLSGTNAITYTDASPTVPEFATPMAQALSQIATLRFNLDSTVFVMHPRRWFWITSGLDSQNRPLVLPNANAFNPLATSSGNIAQGEVGASWLGPRVIIDANVTTTDSSTRDKAYAINTQDSMLFEGSPRTRVLQEVLSGTLQVRFQLYNYVALLHRYAPSISVMSGTGFAAPSGF